MKIIRNGAIFFALGLLGACTTACADSQDSTNPGSSISGRPSASPLDPSSGQGEASGAYAVDDVDIHCELDFELDPPGSPGNEYPEVGLWPVSRLKVTNTSSVVSDYEIEVVWQSTKEGAYRDSQTVILEGVSPGRTARKKVTGFKEADSDKMECVLTSATRTPSPSNL